MIKHYSKSIAKLWEFTKSAYNDS